MKVKEIMTADPGFCFGVDSLTKAAMIMWQRDCGAVPVVNAENQVVGVITDRDICIAAASQDRKASEIRAFELCDGRVWTVSPDDDVRDAIKFMRKFQVRRLPVTDDGDRLVGMLTIADVVNAAGSKKKGKALRKKVLPLISSVTKKPAIHLSEIAPDDEGPVSESPTATQQADHVETILLIETAGPAAPVDPNQSEGPGEAIDAAPDAV
jgi:CBS domain-containing protein